MIDIANIRLNNVLVVSTTQNIISFDNELKESLPYPGEEVIDACLSKMPILNAAALYLSLPVISKKTALVAADHLFEKMKINKVIRAEELPDSLRQRIKTQLMQSALTLLDHQEMSDMENIEGRQLAQHCTENFLSLSASLSQARFEGGDDMTNLMLSERGRALISSTRLMQENMSSEAMNEKLIETIETLMCLSHSKKENISSINTDDANTLLESTLSKISNFLSDMQRSKFPPQEKKLSEINTICEDLNNALLSSNGTVNLSLSQTCMEVQRISAWALVHAATKISIKNGNAEQQALMIDRLKEAMAIEAAIASASIMTLQAAKNGTVNIDVVAQIELKTNIFRFLQITDRLYVISKNEKSVSDPKSGLSLQAITPTVTQEVNEISIAGKQLDQWSKRSDIGTEILRVFMNALIRMRESMRESRQLALTLYSKHAEEAVVALKQQGEDNWKKEIFSAIGLIVSGALQMVPLAYSPIKGCYTKFKNNQSIVQAAKTKNVELAEKQFQKNVQSAKNNSSGSRIDPVIDVQENHVDVDITIPHDFSSRSGTIKANTSSIKKAEAEKMQPEPLVKGEKTSFSPEEIKAQKIASSHNNLLALQYQNAICRALGELAQGSFNIVSAFYGRFANDDAVKHFSENAEMQKQIFQRDKWNVEVDMMTRSMEQVISTITDLQARQTDIVVKLTGRA